MHGLLADLTVINSIIVFVLGVLVLGFFGVPLFVWTLAIGAACCMFSLPAIVAWPILGLMIFLNIKPLRRELLTSRIMKLLGDLGLLPSISETERIAIDAGTVWVDKEFFSGKPDFDRMLGERYDNLSAEEQAFLDGPLEEICQATDDWKVHCEKDLSPEVWDLLKKHRLFGMIIPKKYGGLEFSALANSAVVAKLASRSMPLAVTAMVPNSLGPAELLLHYGTQEQRDHYLPRLADGREIPCFALTEPTAGSDAGSITANGVVFKDDNGDLKIRMNWQKRYITLAAVSTVMGMAFKLRDPDNLLGKGTDLGITCALIPSDMPGLTLGRRHDPMGCPFFNCPMNGEDVILGIDNIIGGVDGVGQGWKMLMECLSAGRAISLPALSTGVAKFVTRSMGAYAQVRHQFGMPIGKFEGVEEALADIAGLTYLLEAGRTYTVGSVDNGEKPSVISAIAKYNFTELSRKIINLGMDVAGGSAISRGPRNLLANTYAATPVSITVEGANILTRTMIVFGQGVIRCHPYAQKEVMALETNDLVAFDDAFFRHMGFVIRNVCRATLLTLTRGRLVMSPVGGPVARYYRKISWASSVFAVLADVAMGGYGGALKRKEKITGRLGDLVSWMYLGMAVLKRYEAEGRRPEDLDYVRWSMDYAMAEMQTALEGVLKNIDLPVIKYIFSGPLLYLFRVNPFGLKPSDDLGAKIAIKMQTPGAQRDALTKDIHIPTAEGEQMALLEEALRLSVDANVVMQDIKQAVRRGDITKASVPDMVKQATEKHVITKEQADQFAIAHEKAIAAIQVDSFDVDDYKNNAVPKPL